MRRLLLPLAVVALAAAGCNQRDLPEPKQPAVEVGRADHFDVKRIASGLNRPTWVGAAPGDTKALWVLEQPGRVLRIEGRRKSVALDLSDAVLVGAEQGLLGIAFHPDFATNGRVFLHFSDKQGDTNVVEFVTEPGREVIDPRPRRRLLFVDQPEENHNGGQLAFGPDGRLYLGLGDGGGAFDPRRTAQDEDRQLGKILATDVEAPESTWEVVLYGLRNPWRFSFDPALGELWIGDVGQDAIEEIDRVLLEPDEPPKNLGWSAYEGVTKLDEHDLEGEGEIVWPVATYSHDEGCSVTGGFVYNGTALPDLNRRYLYGDFCSGALWTLRAAPKGRAQDVRRERATVPQLTHIGEDARQEVVFASGNGSLYRAVKP